MNVFISWSGKDSVSHEAAKLLKEWLPVVIQRLNCFLSSTDIRSGSNWLQALFDNLEKCQFGIICVTAESTTSEWVNFEAGALAKNFERARICPLLIEANLKPTDVSGPLQAFQIETATKEGIEKLLISLNASLSTDALSEQVLKKSFMRSWPELEKDLEKIRASPRKGGKKPVTESAPRPVEDIASETLQLLRGIASGDLPVATKHLFPVGPSKMKAVESFEFWNAVLARVKRDRGLIVGLLRGGTCEGIDGDMLVIRFPNEQSFAKEMLDTHAKFLDELVSELSSRPMRVRLEVRDANE